MSLNVNRNVTDAFYRYKMPKLMAKVEGKGNGIKTVIVNMVDVAKAIGCPPTYPCKFFGCELGAQTQFDFKNERYIVNGSHDPNKLQQLLDIFIKKFILCTECENPETSLFPNEKRGIIKQTCKACGHQTQLDMRHKLTTFILKNPPDVKPDQLGNSKTQKKNRAKGSQATAGGTNGTGSDNDLNGCDDDDDWAVDVSAEAVAERMKDLTAGVKHLTVSNNADRSQGERLELFFNYCKAKCTEGKLVPSAEISVFKDIAAEADSLEVKDNKAVMGLIELLFNENCVKQLSEYRILLLLFTHQQPKVQKYLIGALEKLTELKKDALLNKFPIILKTLYDEDIVEEEVLLEWGKKVSKKYVNKELAEEIHKKAQPFLKWLQEAEEEEDSSSEEESDDNDLEIEYDEKARNITLKEQEGKVPAPKKPAVAEVAAPQQDEDEGSDIDIDDI